MGTKRTIDPGLFLIRLMLGVVFLYHGQGKLFGGLDQFAGYLATLHVPAPHVAAVAAGLAEFGGGLLLLAGVGFRWGLWPLVFTMLVASFTAHAGKFGLQDGGMEYAVSLGAVVAGLIMTGPGAWTVARFLPAGRPATATAEEGA